MQLSILFSNIQAMYRSKEIRWFSPTEDKRITAWFKAGKPGFEATYARTDHYMPLPGKNDMGFKLREGKLEAKVRTGVPRIGKLTDKAEGYLEDWVKWSFNVSKDDPLANDILKGGKYSWIGVYKERMGLKLTEDKNARTRFLDIMDQIDFGCQIEYTRIYVLGQQWFTFGLEWFGDKHLEPDPEVVSDILGDSSLKIDESMGYSEFFNTRLKI